MVPRILFVFFALAALCGKAFAHNEDILSFAVTNYTGYVIASDATRGDPAYNRDAIRASVTVRYTAGSTTSTTSNYRLYFRLLDASGVPVQILDQAGQTNTIYMVSRAVTLPFTIFGATFTQFDFTDGAPLVPVDKLDQYQGYTAEVTMAEQGARGIYFDTGDRSTYGPRTYFHFRNTSSSDLNANVLSYVFAPSYSRSYLVQTDTDKDTFTINLPYYLYRYDSFLSASNTANIQLAADLELRDGATDAVIPLANSHITFSHPMGTHTSDTPAEPDVKFFNDPIEFAPAAGVQLDAVNNTYKLKVTLSHAEFIGFTPDRTNQMVTNRFMQFNGKLFFGAIETQFASILNNPTAGSTVVNSYVNTQLAVDGNSGFVVGAADHTYGNGAVLDVRLRPNGNAELSSGSVVLTGPSPDEDSINNVRYIRGPVTLDTAGAHASMIARLPTGFGYRANMNSRILGYLLPFLNVSLNQDLAPASDLTYSSLIYVAEETKPVWMEVSKTVWKVAAGEFVLDATGGAQYVRKQELDSLEAATVAAPAMKIKRSNEQYFRSVNKVTSPQIVVRADANGNAQMTAKLDFVAGNFRTHFPYDARVVWGLGGNLSFVNDLIQPASSSLTGVGALAMSYNRDCNDVTCPGAVGPATVDFKPDAETLTFTEDGGLQHAGNMTTPTPLTWGWIALSSRYAHRTENWSPANFHMPGLFIRGDRTAKNVAFRPAVILFTGVLPANPANTERPGTTGYQDGFGDYGGLNFRVGTDAALKAESTLANVPTGLYPLTGRSKYYIREAGVSGIHEAVFGSFPSSATLYGYQVQFSNFGLAFLDSQNTDSRTEGSIRVPAPSNFDQKFQKLEFTCLGALKHAETPPGEAGVMKKLEYWAADFTTLAIDFKSDASCNPGDGYLVLGVAAWASHVDQTLYGALGFRSNGNLITQDDGLVSGVTSRLKMPNYFKLKGPSGQNYHFTPVGEAYYNNWDFRGSGGEQGFVNIAGKMDVPFFEDLKVHMHTSAQRSNTTALINLMGGWPSHGFEIGAGNNYFTQTPFDLDNRGYPAAGTIKAYRDGDAAGKYHVRAQRDWLGVVHFDYPLDWSSSTRSFKSHKPITDKFLIVEVEHQVKYLDAENAELTFGIEYQGMPKVNIANLAFNAVDEATGVVKAFENASLGTVRGAIDEGLKKVDQMMNDQMHAFFKQSFDDLLAPQIGAMYDQLKSKFDPGTHTWTVSPNTTIQEWVVGGGAVAETFSKRLKNISGGISAGVGVINEVDKDLAKVQAAIDGIEQILQETGGNRTIAANLIKKLVGQLAADFAGAFVDAKLNDFLKELDPTLDQIYSVLDDLKGVISTLRAQLAPGAEFANEVNAKVTSLTSEIDTVVAKVSLDVKTYFGSFDLSVDSPFQQYSKEEVIAFIRQKLEDRFFACKVPTSIQVILKERIYDLDASLREGIDGVFQQVNGVIKGIISETLADLDNSINGMLGEVNNVMGAGKINGYAHINNDALKLLRLDIYAQLKVPSEMELNAYIQIKELDSEGYPTACLPAGGKATEVSVGATDVHVDWISPDLRADIGFKATFDPGTSPPTLLGVGGFFNMRGEISFETFKIKQLSASMAFGKEENYFSCAARVLINKYEGFGGIYFGRTCTLEPIALWDPEVASVLGTPPFTGAYVYAEVHIPISEALLGIPASCFFNITAGVGAGAFYFVEGPTYGGKMYLDVEGELLCIVSVGGSVKLVGVKNPDGLTLKGTGEVHGDIGPCPFCISFGKSIGMQYKNGSWDVDF